MSNAPHSYSRKEREYLGRMSANPTKDYPGE